MPVQAVRDDPHNAQGAIPFAGDQPPTAGPDAKFGVYDPDVPDGYDLDPALEPNKFPKDTGSDSFGDIGRSIP